MKLAINETSKKLLHKIHHKGMRRYKSQTDIIEKALELLWTEEKLLAYKDLGQKLLAYNNSHPEDAKE